MQTIFAVGAGVVLYLLSDLLFSIGTNAYLFLAVGLVAGYFGGKMLLERRVAVFSLRSFLGLGIIALVFAGSMFITDLDPLDMENRVPEEADVVAVDLRYERTGATFTDPADIAGILDAHKTVVREKPNQGWGYGSVVYTLKDGTKMTRRYTNWGSAAKNIRALFSRPDTVFSSMMDATGQRLEDVASVIAWPQNTIFVYSYADEVYSYTGEDLTAMPTDGEDRRALAEAAEDNVIFPGKQQIFPALGQGDGDFPRHGVRGLSGVVENFSFQHGQHVEKRHFLQGPGADLGHVVAGHVLPGEHSEQRAVVVDHRHGGNAFLLAENVPGPAHGHGGA